MRPVRLDGHIRRDDDDRPRHVRVARVAEPVTVTVLLAWVCDARAVVAVAADPVTVRVVVWIVRERVAGVAEPVSVRVLLAGVRGARAVVGAVRDAVAVCVGAVGAGRRASPDVVVVVVVLSQGSRSSGSCQCCLGRRRRLRRGRSGRVADVSDVVVVGVFLSRVRGVRAVVGASGTSVAVCVGAVWGGSQTFPMLSLSLSSCAGVRVAFGQLSVLSGTPSLSASAARLAWSRRRRLGRRRQCRLGACLRRLGSCRPRSGTPSPSTSNGSSRATGSPSPRAPPPR